MKKTSKKLLLVGVSVIALTGAAIPTWADQGTIKYRQAVMRAQGGHMGAIVGLIKGQVDYKGHLVGHAKALNELPTMVGDAFAKRTEGGKTRAKADIWDDAADFKQKVDNLQKATAALLEAAESGGTAAAGAKLKAVGDACGACHKKFRKKKS